MRIRTVSWASLFTLALTAQVSLAARPPCSAGHCSHIAKRATDQCASNAELLGMSPEEYVKKGGKAVTDERGRTCTCPCSCVVAETNIGTISGYKEIAKLIATDFILTPMSETYSSSEATKLHVSDASNETVQKTQFSNGSKVVSSLNHTFITPKEMVVSAEQLKEGDFILASDGSSVQVDSVEFGTLSSENLFNLSVNLQSNKAMDHVIDTEGVLSGDWLLQSTNDIVQEELFLRTSVIGLFE
jgi:hypothetical protein